MMEEAARLPSAAKRRYLYYRDGLLIAFMSAWPLRRRSIAALTVTRHLEFDAAGVSILLFPEDTKSKRAESFRVPDDLLPFLLCYLKEIRPRHMIVWNSVASACMR
jgi:integrase/recombinase XerD